MERVDSLPAVGRGRRELSESERLALFLLGRGAPPALETLRAARVAPYAYVVLPADHPLRAELRSDYLDALARHQRTRSEILPLLTAWSRAGVDALLFKGFYLAEFIYPAPGSRFYGDVDVAIQPGQVANAVEIALGLGWWLDRDASAINNEQSHEIGYLHSPGGGGVLIDLHRFFAHQYRRWTALPGRATAAIWAGAEVRQLSGVKILTMRPVDSLLVGLIVQRAWGDGWGGKAHDVTDFRFLSEKGGVTREALEERARELGCVRTLRGYLRRHGSGENHLSFRVPDALERLRLNVLAFPEGLPHNVRMFTFHCRIVRELALDMPRNFAEVRRAKVALKGTVPLTELLASMTPPEVPGRNDPAHRKRTVRAIRRLTRFSPTNRRGDCLVRSLSIYSALRRDGWPVEFVCGVRREPGRVVGHAWVELNGRVLPELGEPRNGQIYAESFRYPTRPSSAESEREGSAPDAELRQLDESQQS